MAHPCFQCGGECYCHGDIDDAIVSKTPNGCDGCGCEDFFFPDDDDADFDDDDLDDDWPYYPSDEFFHPSISR